MRPARTRALPMRLLPVLLAGVLLGPGLAQAVDVSATKDRTCAGFRFGSSLNCTAGEFTVAPNFSAAPGTPPFCMAGQEFNFVVDVNLSGSNADRQDIGFYVGQLGNDPGATTAGNICSVATFPTTPAPWENNDGDGCGDYNAAGVSDNRINEIKVVCTADAATGALQVPYLLTYVQNNGGVCTDASSTTLVPGATSKCIKGTAIVNGDLKVLSGGWVDITKVTVPSGNTEDFTFTATSSNTSAKVSALVGATLLTDTKSEGGTYIPDDIDAATNSTTFTLKHGETARVFLNVSSTAQTLTITESELTGWDPVATALTCENATLPGNPNPSYTTSLPDRQVAVTLTTTNFAKKCTITNTKRPRITVTKVSNGDVGTFTFTGTNTWVSQDITTLNPGEGRVGIGQYLPQNTATSITETAVAGYRLTGITCTGAPDYTTDLATRTVSFTDTDMAPGAEIACTFTNQRERSLTVQKDLDPPTDPGLFVMDADGDTSAEGGDGTTVTKTVDVGATVDVAETAGTGTDFVNYTSTYSCNTTPATSGNGTSASFTMPNADITCTFTNTRKQASFTLRKAWQNAISGDTAEVTSTGFTNDATSGSSVSAGSNTTTGTSTTIYSGESGTIAEAFTVGDPVNYNSSLGCTGTSGLSGNTLTVDPADSAITCTYTNARKSASLTLRKSWVDATVGDTVEVTSSGFANNATSGSSVSSGNNTTTGTSVTVYAAESGSITENFNVGNPASYVKTLDCTGTSGLSGNTLTVDPADTVIVCTYTNEPPKPVMSVVKLTAIISDPVNGASNPKSIPGAIRSYTIQVSNSGPGAVDNDSMLVTDVLPSTVALYVGDLGGPGTGPVQFTDGPTSSGLAYTFTSLASATDDLAFSNDNGATWTYTPVPDGNGFDPAVTHVRITPTGTMPAAGAGDPSFTLQYQVRVQ